MGSLRKIQFLNILNCYKQQIGFEKQIREYLSENIEVVAIIYKNALFEFCFDDERDFFVWSYKNKFGNHQISNNLDVKDYLNVILYLFQIISTNKDFLN